MNIPARQSERNETFTRAVWAGGEARAVEVRQAGTREWFAVLDEDCPARSCFRPGPWTVRGATSSGTRNTGAVRLCCLRREGFGCPSPLPAPAWPAGERRRWKRR